MPVKCREMTTGDLEAVSPLLEQLGYNVSGNALARRFEAIRAADGHALLVADESGSVKGLLHVFARPALEKPPEAVVQAMAVAEGARRSGIGRALLSAAEEWARARGFSSVALYSQVERDDAHAFYQELGYARVSTAGLLRKKISPTSA